MGGQIEEADMKKIEVFVLKGQQSQTTFIPQDGAVKPDL
jgi:hypothetical protein